MPYGKPAVAGGDKEIWLALSPGWAFPEAVWDDAGADFLFDAAHWIGTITWYFEVIIKSTNGETARARLYDETAGAAVAGSTLSTTSGAFTRFRSGAITLIDGHTYRVESSKAWGEPWGDGYGTGARIIGIRA